MKVSTLAAMTLLAGSLQVTPASAASMRVSIDNVGWSNQESGSAVVTGRVSCDTPRQVTLYVEMTQNGGDVQASNNKTIDCTNSEHWMITLNPYGNNAFKKGIAGIDASISSTGTESADASETIGVKSCTIIGTIEPETIHGTPRKDVICGLHGADRIFGEASNDVIRSYHGDDYVNGGSGDDVVKAGYGRDEVLGSIGNDTLDGDEQNDFINGGSGSDNCIGGTGSDSFSQCERRNQDG
jgi:Ca2+-binding RTX toxin-like protein